MSKWKVKKAPKVPVDTSPKKCPSCPCTAHYSPSTNLCGHCRMGFPCPAKAPAPV